MKPSQRVRAATLVALLGQAAASACGGGAAAGAAVVRTSPQPAAAGHGDVVAPAGANAEGRYPATEADVRFMTGMISHHAQAIEMARLASTHGASPSIRVLAERIINAQQDEIAIMQQWLRDHGRPVPEARPGPMKMVHDGIEHEMLMPGMLTEAQMKQLDAARGEEFDRLFLTLMIQHHRGAVTMVKDLIGSPGAAQDSTVFKIASDINVDQTTEIDRMQKMLLALLVEPSGS